MRTIKSLLAAVLAIVMIACMSTSAFAVYEETKYDDVDEMYGTTQDGVNILYIRFVDKLGIIASHHNGSFDPAALITRGEALKIAYRMLHYNYDEISAYASESTLFDEMEGGDISDTAKIKPYIAWAQDYGLISADNVPELKFEPEKTVTGEEFLSLIAKVIGVYNGPVEEGEEILSEELTYGSNLSAASESVNREQAAVVVAKAMIYDPEAGEPDDGMFTTFETFEGDRLNCLATKVYGCNHTNLIVSASRNRPMHYDNVTHDVLFSNGVQADVGLDFGEFVGYTVDVIYLDKDGSGTYTQDEELVTYEVVSPVVSTVTMNNLRVVNYSQLSGNDDNATFDIFSTTQLFLNDEIWPKDEIFDLVNQAGYVDFSAPVTLSGRPNMEITFIQRGNSQTADVIFATEWIPGKLMTVTDNYFSVFSYYDGKTYVFEDNDVALTKIANPKSGDYVHFYIAGKTLHIMGGTFAEMTGIKSTKGGIFNEDGSATYAPHKYLNSSLIATNDMKGKLNVVLDYTGTTYIAIEEAPKTKEVAVEILKATPSDDGVNALLTVREWATGKEYDLTVEIARINSATGAIAKGSIFTYYITDGDMVMMNGVDPIETNVIETEDYFIVGGERKYLKVEGYASDTNTFKNGKAILHVDRYGGVWASEAA